MLTLIAESKTMLTEQVALSPSEYETHGPLCEEQADEIMKFLASLSLPELIEETGLSASLGAKMKTMIYEFSNKSSGLKAIEAFTGVVFKSLDFATLSPEAKQRCDDSVRLISSLYGWLRPSDIIKPYRLDFTSKGTPDGTSLFNFWKKYVTIRLVKYLQETKETTVLNLLPSDAAKCIDWKLTKNFCKVWKVDFVEIKEGGIIKTPNASKLKTMRGQLLRQILSEGISDIDTLKHTSSPSYICEGTPVYPDHLRFLC